MTMSLNPAPGTLEEQALRRKQRLLALKRKREGKSDPNEPHNKQHEGDQEILPKPFFRSYKPADEKLHDSVLDEIMPENVKEQVNDQLQAAKSQIILDQLDVTSLEPRKPDWDLKRDIAKKVEKLERQTQRAIAELIRDRLNEKSDLAGIVESGAEVYKD